MNTFPYRFFQAGLWLVLSALVVFTLAGFAGAAWYYADLFAHFRIQLFVGSIVLALVFCFRRCWKAVAIAFAAALVNLSAISSHLAISSALSSGNAVGHSLRCISFNVLQGNQEMDRLERFLRNAKADVMVLQEVSPEHALLLQSMKDQYPHQLVLGRKNSKGAALLTRLPASDLGFHPFEDGEIGAVHGRVQVGSKWVTILGVHSHKPTSATGAATQRRYFRWAADQCTAAQATGPVVIMGDFNATPWSSAFKAFTSQSSLVDTSRGSAFSATWRVTSPQRILIDHCFVSQGIQLQSRTVGEDVGSDHRPLIVDLVVPQDEA
jgi:endonuclease/exonuclease/phosphatase (EEP) superfamily protein YafD